MFILYVIDLSNNTDGWENKKIFFFFSFFIQEIPNFSYMGQWKWSTFRRSIPLKQPWIQPQVEKPYCTSISIEWNHWFGKKKQSCFLTYLVSTLNLVTLWLFLFLVLICFLSSIILLQVIQFFQLKTLNIIY